MRISPVPPLRAVGTAYVTIFRNMPLTVVSVIGQERGHLLVLDPTGSAGVLPLHANGVRAVLQVASVIDDEHALWVAELIHDVAA